MKRRILLSFLFADKPRKLIILVISFFCYSSAMFAFNIPAGNYYFDNSQTQWPSVYLFVGHGSYISSYQLTSSTDIYTVNMSLWSGATGYYFANNNGGVISGSGSYNINTPPGSLPGNQPTSWTAIYGTAPTAGQYYIPWGATGTGITGEWKSDLNAPSAVLNGTNVMFYINQSYGGSLGITDNSSATCKTTASTTALSNTDDYINIAAANVPSTLSVTNNCGGWVGTGAFTGQTSANAAGARYLTGASTSKTSTSISVTPSLSSIPQGTTLIYLQATTAASTSSYGRNMYVQYYIDGETSPSLTSNRVTSTSTSTTYLTGSLSVGTHTIIPVLTDRLVFLKGSSFTVTVTPTTPNISGISSSLPAYSTTQTYKGATIRVTGTNLSSVSIIKLGGSTGTSITTSSPTTISATDIFFVVPDGTSAGTIYVSDGTNTFTSAGSIANLGYISTSTGNWSSTNTWLGGTLPSSTDNVTIAHATGVTLDGDRTVANLTINYSTGNLTMNNNLYTLTIAANGTFKNDGSLTSSAGTINFAGNGTVSGVSPTTFKNLTLNSGVLTLTTVPTIDGTFTINNGNVTAAPKYTSNSTLYYNVGYNRYLEWSATGIGTLGTTAGYPNNVTVNNGTLTVVNGDAGTARAMAGNLVVNTGATFTTGVLNAIVTVGGNLATNGTGTIKMSSTNANLNVVGNITNAGTINLETTTARLKATDLTNTGTITLSSTSGGDLELSGSLIDNATFNANTRAVFFTGAGTQDVSGTGTFNIDYIVSNKASGSIRMLCDLLCEGPNGGHALTLTGSNDILDLNGHVLTLGKATIASDINGSGSIKGSSTSSISILGTGALGTLSFTSGSQTLNNLTIDRQTSGSVILGTALTLSGQLTLTNGTFTNSTNLTLGNGATVVRSAGTLSAAPTFGSTVNLTYTGSATKGNEFPSTDIINTLTVNNTGGIALADNRNIPNLSIGSGSSLSVNAGKQLTVSTSMSNSGTLNLLSTNTDGTATILTPSSITNSSATYHVYQYIGGARNWYVSSPVSAATASSNYTYYVRNEGANSWPVVSTGSALAVGTGYIANLSAGTSTIDFTGGILNNGDKTVTLTRNTGVTKEGFNLVGNPYPSHITLSKTITDAANSLNTIWYRTASWDGSKYVYAFSTCLMNQDGTYMSTPYGTSTNIVSPMQAFWVRANSGGGTLTFANTMRSHQSSNPLKAPANINVTQQVLRLQVTNNNAISDETILYFNSNASNEFDSYDAPKMANASVGVPELYTLATSSTEQLAINGLNSIPLDTEIPLGFTTGETNTFTIKASEFSNFDAGTTLILKDYHDINNPVIADLSDGSSYLFSSDITSNNTSRFALIFKSPSSVTGINGNSNPNLWISVNSANQVVVTGNSGESSVAIYTAIGQKLYSKNLTSANTTLNTPLQAGVYMVTVTNAGKSITKKITIS